MSLRVGKEVLEDHALLSYARDLWASGQYQNWRAHMHQDVEDELRSPVSLPVEDHPEEA